MVLLPQFRAPSYIEAIARYRGTWLSGVPTMLALVARETDLLAESDLSSVERIGVGSAPLAQSLIETVKRIFPGALVTNGYGTTEAGPICLRPGTPPRHPAPGHRVRLPHRGDPPQARQATATAAPTRASSSCGPRPSCRATITCPRRPPR